MIHRVALFLTVLAVAVALAHRLDGRTIRTGGVVTPHAEWKLIATEGGIVEQLQRNGVTALSRGWQGIRGDPIEISLFSLPGTGDTVRAGQRVARVVFPLESHGLATSNARLDGAQAELRLLQAGPRPEAVAAAAATARSAHLEATRAASEAARACSLWARSLISREEYERIAAGAQVAQADAEAALAELDLSRAGPRCEELDAVRAEIAALEAEAAEAMDRAETTIVSAPMDAVIGDLQPDCLIVLQKTDTVLIALPLDQRVWNRVTPGDPVEVTNHRRCKATGVIARLGQSAGVMGTSVSMAAFAEVPNGTLGLRPGMTVRAVIRPGSS
ncbi:MAG: hypothetical protein MUE60_11680 [Candidatus Eisenbacteria bacterium]|nr:hypothetical protein [Candidatus Eisenbacteria bacterium]